jgi:hypothetical protein
MLTLKVRFVPDGVCEYGVGPYIEVQYGLETKRMPVNVESPQDTQTQYETEDLLVFQASAPSGPALTPKQTRRLSQKQELDLAQSVGGRVQPGSGSKPGAKGDIRVKGVVRGEAKYTKAGSYRLELADLQKIRSECTLGERMAFLVRFVDDDNRTKDEFALISRSDWEEWVEFRKGQR